MTPDFQYLKKHAIRTLTKAALEKMEVLQFRFTGKESDALLLADVEDVGQTLAWKVIQEGWPRNADGHQTLFGIPFVVTEKSHPLAIVCRREPVGLGHEEQWYLFDSE